MLRCFFSLLVLTCMVAANAQTFDFVIETTEENEAFTFYLYSAANFDIDWGDGNETPGVSGTANVSHQYVIPGVYTNRVSGTAARLAFGAPDCTPWLLRDIVSCLGDGVAGINSTQQMFMNASNITEFAEANWFNSVSSNVKIMSSMFHLARNFNQDLSGWDVGNVTDMNRMFYEANAFNGDISGWNVSKVTSMVNMFQSATSFNGDISGWDVSNVAGMGNMFYNATAFNQDISGWDVSNVSGMGWMFYNTRAFKQNLSRWNISSVSNMRNFLFRGSVPTEYYNRMLIKWSHLPLQSGVEFHGGDSKYDLGLPEERREHIETAFGWTITDGGTTGVAFRDYPFTILVR